MNWSSLFARRTEKIQPSAIREILKLTQGGEVISFAGGLPAPALFPIERIREASDRVLAQQGERALQYSTTEGYPPLRAWAAEQLPGADAERVQIVSGSQQALDLVAKALLDPGDRVVLAAPTYMGALRAFDPYQPEYLTVASDEDGLLPDSLEAALKRSPKLVYVIPNFDNPRGTTMSLERRRNLLESADRYGVLIFEDDPYGQLRFEGEPLPSLFELAPDRVVYSSTLSKTVAPGLRIAWLVAAPELLEQLTRIKQAADLHTSTLGQMVAHAVVEGDFLAEQLPRIRSHYHRQRDAMLAALDTHLPSSVHSTRPKGGMFLWLTLPAGSDGLELLQSAARRGVAYVPGAPFFADGLGLNTLRLSYSVASLEQIERGVATLGAVLTESLAVAS
ncbi:MAG: PLP-dependent aminotransferase family protein [Truepera sp.]|nr:PLP-dependent aminotransferase family protein [Truepera sp.]